MTFSIKNDRGPGELVMRMFLKRIIITTPIRLYRTPELFLFYEILLTML
jgi:hypothetical protein